MDPATINYLTDIIRILSDESDLDPDEKSDILFPATVALGMIEKELQVVKAKIVE